MIFMEDKTSCRCCCRHTSLVGRLVLYFGELSYIVILNQSSVVCFNSCDAVSFLFEYVRTDISIGYLCSHNSFLSMSVEKWFFSEVSEEYFYTMFAKNGNLFQLRKDFHYCIHFGFVQCWWFHINSV